MELIGQTLDQVDRDAWDRRAASVPDGTLYHTTSYAEHLRWAYREIPVFLMVRRGREVVAQWLCSRGLVMRAALAEAPWGGAIALVARRVAGMQYGSDGPLVFDPRDTEDALRLLLDGIDRLARAHRAVGVEVVHSPFLSATLSNVLERALAQRAFATRPAATVQLALDAGIEQLWDRVGKDARQKVRKAEAQGIQVWEAHAERDLDAFSRICRETAVRNRIRRPTRRLARIRETYGSAVHMFVSARGDQPLSAQILYVFNGIGFLGMVSCSNAALAGGLYGNDLMQWTVIKWAKAQGVRLLDWSGYALNPSPKEIGINRFKTKWGGQVTRFAYCTKIVAAGKHAWIDRLRRWKRNAQRHD